MRDHVISEYGKRQRVTLGTIHVITANECIHQ